MNKQDAVDQLVCHFILEHRLKRVFGATDPDRDLVPGDTVQVQAGGEAVIEQRHLDALKLFRENYSNGSAAGVTFRIEPKNV